MFVIENTRIEILRGGWRRADVMGREGRGRGRSGGKDTDRERSKKERKEEKWRVGVVISAWGGG